MKKRSVLFSVLFINIIFFTTCKKYEDDPYFINFRTPEARIHGTWDLESLIIDGKDSTSAVKNQECYAQLSFLDESEALNGIINLQGYHYPLDSVCMPLEGTYTFTNNHNELCLWGNYNIRPVGPYPCNSVKPGNCWKIIKLTGSQLWLETTFNNLLCQAHLKKIS